VHSGDEGREQRPPAEHVAEVAMLDQCPPRPSPRAQTVGEEPAGRAGFLLSHEGGAASHQQPCPPLEVLAVPGSSYMTLGDLA